jgi:hypothetical protein
LGLIGFELALFWLKLGLFGFELALFGFELALFLTFIRLRNFTYLLVIYTVKSIWTIGELALFCIIECIWEYVIIRRWPLGAREAYLVPRIAYSVFRISDFIFQLARFFWALWPSRFMWFVIIIN